MQYFEDYDETLAGQFRPDPDRHFGFSAKDQDTGAIFTAEELARGDEPGHLAVLVSVQDSVNGEASEPVEAQIEEQQIRAGNKLKIAMAAGAVVITVAVGGLVVRHKKR